MVQMRCPECGYLQTLSEERFITISEDFLNCPHCHAKVPKQWIPAGGNPVPEEVQHKMLAFSRRILNGGEVGLEVVQALESLVRQHGATDESIKALGIGYANLGENKKAEEFLLLARKEAPEDTVVLQSLLEVLLAQKKFAEAVDFGQTLLERLGPRAADQDVARLALALTATGRSGEAEGLLASFPDLDLRHPLVKQAKRQVSRGSGRGLASVLSARGPLAWLFKGSGTIDAKKKPSSVEPPSRHQMDCRESETPASSAVPGIREPARERPVRGKKKKLAAIIEYWIYAPASAIPSWEDLKDSLSRLLVSEEELSGALQYLESAIERDELAVEYIVRDDASDLFHYPEDLIPRNGRDLSETDRNILMNAQTIVRLRLSLAHFSGVGAVRFMGLLVEAVRALTGGVVQDAISHVLWGTEQWHALLDNPGVGDVESHVQIEMLDEGGIVWIHTHGMGKFGLPDLELEGVAADFASDGRALIVRIARALITALGPNFDLKSPLSVPDTPVLVPFAIKARDEEGHFPAGSLLLAPHLPGEDAQDTHHSLTRVLAAMRSSDTVSESSKRTSDAPKQDEREGATAESHDDRVRERLLSAHRRAREDLSLFKTSFVETSQARTHVHAVKVGFPAQNSQFEWMWVSLEAWRGSSMVGRLENVPVLRKDLRKGSRVHITEGQIFDWAISREGYLLKGPYTEHITQSRS
jgi:tetratricopeptide (TPR) repeat protein/uncharacterized protein YegJ (DUF2314 family)